VVCLAALISTATNKLFRTAAGTNRTLANYRQAAAQANTVVPGGGLAPGGGNGGVGGGVGGGATGGIPGTTAGDPNAPAGTPPPTAGAGIISAPATYMLLAAAGFAILL